MIGPKKSPYGSWKSPISSDLIVGGSVVLSQPALDGENAYWIEMRPSEGGRYVIVRHEPSARRSDVNQPPFNARTRVHEYGGGDYLVHQDAVYFSNYADQRMYVQKPGEAPRALTPPAAMRYVDRVMDESRRRLICVREDHTVAGQEAVNTIVSVSLESDLSCGETLVSGNDFYSSPRLSPDGKHLAWITWNHPNMPWDETELWIGRFGADGTLDSSQRIAGGPGESIVQPEWSPDGRLYFISDRNGWWNLYRSSVERTVEPVCEIEAEFGLPHWIFGRATYAFASSETIVCNHIKRGVAHLARIDTRTGQLTDVPNPFSDVAFIRAQDGHVVFVGGSPSQPQSVIRLDLASGEFEVLRRSSNLEIDSGYISEPQAIEFPTEGGKTAHAFFYAPKNADYRAPDGELPPLLVKSHGGPTSAAPTSLSLTIQYWTSRGIAVLDVNYGGSTGFGREYRERLKGMWGVVDVDDCVNGARYLVQQGKVDGNRLMITGGSAGGYTTLCALTFRQAFKAGASHYGVSDAEALAKETHKFESRYLDQLFGPYPECRDIYVERSPIHFTDKLSCPVIFFQGLEDAVVPPNQAERMVEALKSKGIPVAYVPFEGEQHGFRQAQNIKRALDAELYFYSRVFGFELSDEVEPVEIHNLRDVR